MLGSTSCQWKSLVLNYAWLAHETAPVWSLAVQAGSPASNTPLHLHHTATLWPVSMEAYFGLHGYYPESGVMSFILRHLNPQPQACFPPGQRANAITSVTNLHSWELSLLTETFIWDSSLQGAGEPYRKWGSASICCLCVLVWALRTKHNNNTQSTLAFMSWKWDHFCYKPGDFSRHKGE